LCCQRVCRGWRLSSDVLETRMRKFYNAEFETETADDDAMAFNGYKPWTMRYRLRHQTETNWHEGKCLVTARRFKGDPRHICAVGNTVLVVDSASYLLIVDTTQRAIVRHKTRAFTERNVCCHVAADTAGTLAFVRATDGPIIKAFSLRSLTL